MKLRGRLPIISCLLEYLYYPPVSVIGNKLVIGNGKKTIKPHSQSSLEQKSSSERSYINSVIVAIVLRIRNYKKARSDVKSICIWLR
jgi:hypothetical protein